MTDSIVKTGRFCAIDPAISPPQLRFSPEKGAFLPNDCADRTRSIHCRFMPAPGSIFDLIRSSCARVASRAEFVRVREDRLADYARSLPIETLRSPTLDPESHFIGTESDTVAF